MNTAHLDYETLADLAEGLLDDELTASAGAHLEHCLECRDRSAELAEVTRLLAEVPAPPIPAELADRIDAALAAEAAATSAVPSLEARRGRRHLRILSAAAAAAVVVGGGAVLTRTAMNSPITSEASKAQSSAPVQERDDRSGAAGGTAASPNSAPDTRSEAVTRQDAIVASGTDYRPDTLGAQVAAELRRHDRATPLRPATITAQRMTGCLHRIAADRRPLLVDMAGFEGRPATIIALPGGGADRLDVWVVGPSCSADTNDVIQHTVVPAEP